MAVEIILPIVAILLLILLLPVFIKLYNMSTWKKIKKSDERDIKGQVVIVTGANGGIGKETAMELVARGATVIFACRNVTAAEDAMKEIREKVKTGEMAAMKLDLSSLESVRQFVKEFKLKYSTLNILVNNAGVFLSPNKRFTTTDGFEMHMGVNHLGHFLLTNLLLDTMKKSTPARIVTVSSMGHVWAQGKLDTNDLNMTSIDVANIPFYTFPLYSISKLANALFSQELAKRVEGTGITTYCLCPGAVGTNLFGHEGNALMKLFNSRMLGWTFTKPASVGARTSVYCCISKTLENETGRMYKNSQDWAERRRIPLEDEEAKRLWIASEQALGFSV